MPPQQSLNELLEQYLFSVAATYIDLIEPDTQDQLIHLINRVNTDSDSTNSLAGLPGISPKAGAPQATESIAKQLKKQWERALVQPLSPNNIQSTERNAVLKRLMTIRQASIDSTISSIGKVDQLLAKASIHVDGDIRNMIIIDHYQSIRKRYSLYLAKLQELQQKELNRLKQHPS